MLDQVQTTQPPSSNSRSFQNECWSESSIWSSIISTSVPIISPRPGSLHWSTAYLNPHPERLTARQEQMVCSSRWEPDGSQHRGCAITWDAPVSTQFNGFCLFFFSVPDHFSGSCCCFFLFLIGLCPLRISSWGTTLISLDSASLCGRAGAGLRISNPLCLKVNCRETQSTWRARYHHADK